ncbi:MAG TPA: zinc-dependent metalloprotease [Actinomycetota bacterium]|jgi:putative hydrolase|nr:zinc-dependent metalloprotease [Actinomycetota bacterium]
MTGPTDPDRPDQGPEDLFADVPLFREIQRVLLAGTGPINWELARQVGIAQAVGQRPDPEPSDQNRRGFESTVRAAELAVADLTGLSPPAEVTRVEAVRRAVWVEANIRGLKGLFEPAAEKLSHALSQTSREQAPATESPFGLEMLMDRMTPLLMGMQVGVVLGTVGQKVLGQYELPIPRTESPALLFVVPNIAELEREWSLPPVEFRAWVALHETTHAFELGRPWAREHFFGLIRELVDGMELDLSGIEERLAGLDLSDPERLSETIGDPVELLGKSLGEEQRLLLARLQAFMAAAEGYADHVMQQVGRKMLPAFERIDEAMRRRREERSQEERMVERMLGIDLKREQYRLGGAFCERVVELTDEQTLALMWTNAESLPSMPELEEPRLWLARMA